MLLIPGKIPVRVHPLFWILIFTIGWINSFHIANTLIWAFVIMISVLFHEYGHALTAVFFGQRAQIQLTFFGGVTYRSGPTIKLWQEFLIVLNGPLAGLLLSGLAFFLKKSLSISSSSALAMALNIAILVNVFWTFVNLLPIQPLDGGHLLRIIMEGLFGFKGVKMALFFSILLSAAFALFFIAIREVFLGIVFLFLTFESYRLWKGTIELSDHDRDVNFQKQFHEAEAEYRHGNTQDAIRKLKVLRDSIKKGVIFVTATEYLADIYAKEGKPKEVFALLSPIASKLTSEGLQLLQKAAYQTQQWDDAIKIGNKAYQQYPHYNAAFINALCFAIKGDAKPAIGWLQCAIRDGMPDAEQILKKREFDNIRHNNDFQSLQKQVNQ